MRSVIRNNDLLADSVGETRPNRQRLRARSNRQAGRASRRV